MQPTGKPKVFYGWYIVAIVFLSMVMVYGVRLSFSVFFVAIIEDFGWTRAETAGMFSINMIVYGVSSVLGGYLIDRFGGRKVFPIGGVLLAVVLLAMSRATALWHFYILYGAVLGTILGSMGYVAFAAVLSPWFSRLRGAAMGIAFIGLSLATIVSILSQYIISVTGWQGGFQILGIITVVVMVPASAIFLRKRPEDIGLLPDGGAKGEKNRDDKKAGTGEEARVVNKSWAATQWTLRKAMKTSPFWGLLLAEFLIATAINFIIVHQVAYSVDLGFSKMYAATIFGLTGVFGMLGIFGGALSDRLGREWTYLWGYLGLILSLLILMGVSTITQPWMLWAFAASYGICRGVSTPLFGAIAADLFQGKTFGTIIGVMNWGYGLGAAFGSWLAGYIFDLTGSYNLAFSVVISAYVLAIVVIWFIVAPRRVRLVPGQIKQKKVTLETENK
ncbi:MFS transporter [Chloroflexota bacterium]